MGAALNPLSDFFVEHHVAMNELSPGLLVPRRFGDVATEHMAVRRSAGLFDFSFMSCFELEGSGCRRFLNWVQTRDLSQLKPGRVAYTLLCRADGSVFVDATVWSLGGDRFWLFTGRRSDLDFVRSAAVIFNTTVCDRSGQYSVIALQGPRSRDILDRIGLSSAASRLRYYRFARTEFMNSDMFVARLGYTGEHGYELLIDSTRAVQLWRKIREAGVPDGLRECGFDAANSLRIEAGYILFAAELLHRVTPYALGYGRLVRNPRLHRYMGATGLKRLYRREPQARLVGLVPVRGADPTVTTVTRDVGEDGVEVPPVGKGRGCLTSAARSPLFGRWLGMGYVDSSDRYPGSLVHFADGAAAKVARLPYFDPARARARA
jgi:aminomethyltransferase